MQIETLLAPPLPRYWFENLGQPDLLQVQQDRIVHNWRQQSDNSLLYPRYEPIKERFKNEVDIFAAWLEEEGLGAIRPNQCEVTYVNIIMPPDQSAPHKMESITPLWTGQFSEALANQFERAVIQTTFLISADGKPLGRVYANFQPAFRQSDLSPVIKLEITARGRPKGETLEDAFNFLDLGREQVVRTFAAVTASEMHKVWGRSDDRK